MLARLSWRGVACARRGLTNVTFAAGDFAAIGSEHGVFDAAVGRRVLMYQADPVAALRAVVRVLRPGALVVFQEADGTMVPASSVALPLAARANRWMWQTVEREGGNIHMGFELAHALEQAGLVVEQLRAEAIVQTPKQRQHPRGRRIELDRSGLCAAPVGAERAPAETMIPSTPAVLRASLSRAARVEPFRRRAARDFLDPLITARTRFGTLAIRQRRARQRRGVPLRLQP